MSIVLVLHAKRAFSEILEGLSSKNDASFLTVFTILPFSNVIPLEESKIYFDLLPESFYM